VVYFNTRSGTFQPTVFLAVSGFIEDLQSRNKLVEFTKYRKAFEDFLISHKEATTLLIKQLGSGARHIPRLREYYAVVLNGLIEGKSHLAIEDELANDPNFAFLTKLPTFSLPPDPESFGPADRKFKRGTKTAAFFAAALPNGARCNLCGALVHRNSIQFDHDKPLRIGGSASLENAKVSHPYCNSIKDHLIDVGGDVAGDHL
jgi:hypothetical protein